MGRISNDRIKRFKKDEFAIQLMMAMGDQQISKFCKSIGMRTTDLREYLNQQKDAPPAYNTLMKIVASSVDKSVTLESLALDAGFTKKTLQEYEAKHMPHETVMPPTKAKIVPKEEKPVQSVQPVKHVETKPAVKDTLMLSAFIGTADSYDEYNPPVFFIFEGRDRFKAFGKLVRLHGLNKALEYATEKESPLFELKANVISKFLSDRPIMSFCALNGNKFAIVL